MHPSERGAVQDRRSTMQGCKDPGQRQKESDTVVADAVVAENRSGFFLSHPRTIFLDYCIHRI